MSRLRSKLQRTLRITLAWVVVALMAALFEHNVWIKLGADSSLMDRIDERFLQALLAGILGGGLYIFLLRDQLRKLPYFKALGMMVLGILFGLVGSDVNTGAYRFVRHPIYTGVLTIVVGLVVPSGSAVTLAIGLATIAFFNVKARWEEDRLAETYPDYRDYARTTPRFVPRPSRGSSRPLTLRPCSTPPP